MPPRRTARAAPAPRVARIRPRAAASGGASASPGYGGIPSPAPASTVRSSLRPQLIYLNLDLPAMAKLNFAQMSPTPAADQTVLL